MTNIPHSKLLHFEDCWMKLYAATCNKLLHITVFTKDTVLINNLNLTRKYRIYAHLNEFTFMGTQDQFIIPLREDKSTTERPYLPFYIRVDDLFFQLSGIFQTTVEANQHMENREDVALITISNSGYHFIASIAPSEAL